MEDDKNYILGVRCKDWKFPAKDSIKVKCVECNQDVWIGKALQNQKVDGVVCQVCVRKVKSKFHDINYIIKPEVAHEVISHIKSIIKDNLYCEIKHIECKHVNPQNNPELAYENCSGEYCE